MTRPDSSNDRLPEPAELAGASDGRGAVRPAFSRPAAVPDPAEGRGRFQVQPAAVRDFRRPVSLASGDLRKLRLRQLEMVRGLAAHLSIYLRLEVGVEMASLDTEAFQKWVQVLPAPTHLTLFKVEPLAGIGLVEMAPRLGLTLVDRLLGGPARSVEAKADLSEIDIALLDQVVQMILKDWCAGWAGLGEAQPAILGHEDNAGFLNTSLPDALLLVLTLETRVGDCTGTLRLAFPWHSLEPLIRSGEANALGEPKAPTLPSGSLQWNPHYDEVQIRLQARWQGLELTARQLATLKTGDVLMLEPEGLERVEICLEEQPRFQGRLGASGRNRAVELTTAVKK